MNETDYTEAIGRLEKTVQAELDRGILGGVAVALIDDQRIVCARGFGLADKGRRVPATEKTVYRAGSISKLFSAVAVMQLVEQGKLELDKPITAYLPGFRIVVPFEDAAPITLRQLLCHRAGMIRESPVGGYFDGSQPTIARSVASVAPCVLVHRPNAKTKYSNIGATIAGHAVQEVAGQPFAQYQRQHVLGPLEMDSSGFLFDRKWQDRAATGYMQVADGRGGFREIAAPRFELGTIPAGNLYTTAADLARFVRFLLAGGRAGEGQLLRPETLRQMFTVQLIAEEAGFGLGFHVGKFRKHDAVSHMGAVYGHTSSVLVLPEEKIGVVVLTNEDIALGPVRHLTDAAVDLMLEAKLGERPRPEPKPVDVARERLEALAGDYESAGYWARVELAGGKLGLNVSGQRLTMMPTAEDKFLAEGRWAHRAAIEFRRDDAGRGTGFTALAQEFRRVEGKEEPDVPEEWGRLLGSYGPEFIPLVISVRHGHLYAMTENMVDYRLRPVGRTLFAMPAGLYEDEHLVFQLGADGRVHGVILANMVLPRAAAPKEEE